MGNDVPLDIHNDHNVYILGAGFSYDGGLPLVSTFVAKMRDAYDWLVSKSRGGEAQAIRSVLEFRHDAAAAALRVRFDPDNVEELFSLASAQYGGGMEETMRRAIGATLDFSEATSPRPDLFLFLPKDVPGAPGFTRIPLPPNYGEAQWAVDPYAFYVGCMLGIWRTVHRADLQLPPPPSWTRCANTIITFNYDLLVEQALLDLGLACSYNFHEGVVDARRRPSVNEGEVSLLKLHGSLNWAEADTRASAASSTASPDETREITVVDDYEDVRRSGNAPVLIPPTWNKRFSGQLTRPWESSIEALRTATRVIIVGFSMPPTDTHFRYLLGAGLQHNISLRDILFVNPAADSAEMRARLAEVFQPSQLNALTLVNMKWRDFVVNDQGCAVMGRPLGTGVSIRDEAVR